MTRKFKKKEMLMLVFLTIVVIYSTESATCTRERCCLIEPCTSSYCTSKNNETWSDSTNSYVYTKLVLSNNSCKPCPYDCQYCSSETICTTCGKGFYMDTTTARCLLCSDRCLSCTVVNLITKCSSCDSGTYLDSVTQSCKSCPTGAKTCSSSTAIIDCQTGYKKASNSLYCTACPSNCISCPVSDSVCATCSTGYYLNVSSCVKCTISNCNTCSKSGSTVYCTSCASGYLLKSGACVGCPSNCKTCTSTTTCTVCNESYYALSGACSSVSTAVSNCATYSSATACSACSSSFYLTSSQCYPCSLLCATCDGSHFGRCTACNSNAALFNKMCRITNFPSTSTYNLYFSFPGSFNLITSGALSCSNQYVSGSVITISLDNLKTSKLEISWKVFSQSSESAYSVALSNTGGNFSSSFSTSSSSKLTGICDNDSSTSYLDIQKSQSFTTIKKLNALTFSTANGVSLLLQ